MNARNIFPAVLLFLLAAGLQKADAQGFRVYKSDGTVAQFSLRTDSIVFYDGIGTDTDFGPFTPVNQCIAGTWYKSKTESLTFNEDGTTDYMPGSTYEFMPYQGTIVVYNTFGAAVSVLKVHKVSDSKMLLTDLSGRYSKENYFVLNSTPIQLVTGIVLSEISLTLSIDDTKRLTATVEPADADNAALVWESSNEAVAEVNSSGRITANAGGTCVITCYSTDGSGVKAECNVKVYNEYQGATDGHEWIDLGLPSGTLWATCNVGASSPEEYGGYYAWGETKPKNEYSYQTYKWMASGKYTKYCTQSDRGNVDNLTELLPEDDAATANWGSNWQMPSKEQCEELINSNYIQITHLPNGILYTSKSNGESIYVPRPGYMNGTTLTRENEAPYYWSRTLDANNNDCAWHIDDTPKINSNGRSFGWSVRPVRKQ